MFGSSICMWTTFSVDSFHDPENIEAKYGLYKNTRLDTFILGKQT